MRLFPKTKTQEQEYNDLRAEGFFGSLNDMIYKKLKSQGLSGSANDMLPDFNPIPVDAGVLTFGGEALTFGGEDLTYGV